MIETAVLVLSILIVLSLTGVALFYPVTGSGLSKVYVGKFIIGFAIVHVVVLFCFAVISYNNPPVVVPLLYLAFAACVPAQTIAGLELLSEGRLMQTGEHLV